MPADIHGVAALGARGEFRARRRVELATVTGEPAAELSLVPDLFVDRTASALRRATPPDPAGRADALVRAGAEFADGTVAGLSPAEYDDLVARVGGVPVGIVRGARRAIGERLARIGASVRAARPEGAVDDWRDDRTRSGCAVWRRRGEVFAVQSAGNHPGTHSLWPEALALGYRVAVRPSNREPFTPQRLITALRTTGFGPDHVALLPTEHSGAEAVLRAADRSLVYGGADVVARFAGDPTGLTRGPGRSKVLIGADADWRAHLDTVVSSIAGHGGTGCVNATAVLVEGDPAPVAAALAERLEVLPSLPPQDEKAVLPVVPAAQAERLDRYLAATAAGTTPWLGGDGVADDLGDGSAALRPAVHEVGDPGASQVGVELPFPCVWVAPWSRAAGTAPLRGSLVVTVISEDPGLVDDLLAEPDVANVYVGDQPTHRMEPGMPHDDYLASFLMRSKGVVRD